MKTENVVLNVLGIIAAAILSVILTVVLIAAPVISSVSSFTDPKTIKEIIVNLDYAELFGLDESDQDAAFDSEDQHGKAEKTGKQGAAELPTLCMAGNATVTMPLTAAKQSDSLETGIQNQIQQTLGDSGIPMDAMEKIMETEAANQILDLVTEEVILAVQGEEGGKITSELLKQIVKDNIDEIAAVAYEYIDDKSGTSLEKLKTMIVSEVETKAADFAQTLNTMQATIVENTNNELMTVVKYSANGVFTIVLWGMIIVLSALIALCRFPRFKGFMWLGVVYLLGAVCSLVLFIVCNNILPGVLEGISADGKLNFLLPVVDMVVSEFGKWAILSFVIAIVMIAVFVVGRIWRAKKQTAPPDACNNLSFNEITPPLVTDSPAPAIPNTENESTTANISE